MSEKPPVATDPAPPTAKVQPPPAGVPPSTTGASTTPPNATPAGPEAAPPKPARKPGYTNPAFKAMGIPALRLPSRNWSIFWAVLSVGVGGYAYDRYQVKQTRKKWMARVEHLGQQPLLPNVTARKITVYVAPPPNDYLDESLAIFRRYVKPILNAGGVDFEIMSENRQGVIRSLVAADVRAVRREYLEAQEKKKVEEDAKRWYSRVKSWFFRGQKPLTKDELAKAEKADFDYKKLLATYYKNEKWTNSEIVNEDSFVSDPTAQGGVICIGRGAYKEFLHGLHEGLLGPLDKPLDHDEMAKVNAKGQPDTPKIEEVGTDAIVAPEVTTIDSIVNSTSSTESTEPSTTTDSTTEGATDTTSAESTGPTTDADSTIEPTPEEEVDENGQKILPIPKPFIETTKYSEATYAPELPPVVKHNGVTAVFQQPIIVIPVYHLLGFLQMPWRIYRFYNHRSYADEYGRAAVAVVENVRSRFTADDVDLGKGEEEDWPKKWVEKGKERGSEWVSELVTDERVLEKLWVFDPKKVVEQKKEE